MNIKLDKKEEKWGMEKDSETNLFRTMLIIIYPKNNRKKNDHLL